MDRLHGGTGGDGRGPRTKCGSVAELVEFAALCCLDYAGNLVFDSFCPPSVGSELALGRDVLGNRQFELECLAAATPHLSSTTLCPEGGPDALDIPTPRTYAEAITVSVRGSTSFGPSPKMTTLRMLVHVAAQRDYELHSVDFSTAFLQGSLHEAIWTALATLGFALSTADPSLFLRIDTSLPPFYVLVYVDDLVFATTDTEALALVKAELQERHTCTDLGELRSYLGLQISQDRARRTVTLTQSHMVHCEAEIYAGAMAAQELRWLTYLLTDLGERPRSPPVLYVDNKAMIALCQDQRLEHITKHIALHYFLMRELQQHG
ncbi:unnamed protein product [Closterium sp. NIES-54]